MTTMMMTMVGLDPHLPLVPVQQVAVDPELAPQLVQAQALPPIPPVATSRSHRTMETMPGLIVTTVLVRRSCSRPGSGIATALGVQLSPSLAWFLGPSRLLRVLRKQPIAA